METCLQITDHWMTIISGTFTIILTLIATWLAWETFYLSQKDKQKTIAIDELKKHTRHLEDLLLLQIQPRFTTKLSATDYMNIINIGGDCFNLKITSDQETFGKQSNPFETMDDFFSSSSAKSLNYSIYGDRNFIFSFEDKFGNKMKQTLFTSKKRFSNLETLNESKNPEHE
jgi:hypothetical protein